MALFISLVKALLLHSTDTDKFANDVVSESAKKILQKIRDDTEYQDWLADRFFVFYLNRTKSKNETN